jgi:hypothetical protein
LRTAPTWTKQYTKALNHSLAATPDYITSAKTDPHLQLGNNGNEHADYGANPTAGYTNR